MEQSRVLLQVILYGEHLINQQVQLPKLRLHLVHLQQLVQQLLPVMVLRIPQLLLAQRLPGQWVDLPMPSLAMPYVATVRILAHLLLTALQDAESLHLNEGVEEGVGARELCCGSVLLVSHLNELVQFGIKVVVGPLE